MNFKMNWKVLIQTFQNSAILYIAGFVKRKLQTTLRCQPCLEAINLQPTSFHRKSLIDLKDRGGLMYPSADLVKVCQVTESKIQVFKSDQTLFNRSNIFQRICVKSTSTMLTQFPSVLKSSDHRNLHKYNLLKQISLIYSTLRLRKEPRTKLNQTPQKIVQISFVFSPMKKFFKLYVHLHICLVCFCICVFGLKIFTFRISFEYLNF